MPLYVLLSSNKYRDMTIVNGILQLLLFLFVAHIPGYRTGILSYVDIAWPLGLVTIGLVTLAMGTGWFPRKVAISAMYLLIGGRMGLGALTYWSKGFMKREFPRYDYRKLVWKEHKIENTAFEL